MGRGAHDGKKSTNGALEQPSRFALIFSRESDRNRRFHRAAELDVDLHVLSALHLGADVRASEDLRRSGWIVVVPGVLEVRALALGTDPAQVALLRAVRELYVHLVLIEHTA